MSSDAVRNATEIQRVAADPAASVILRASAGAGKTKVLVDRFVRLCVEDGPGRADPRSILAVTFTRKAAVEIQERLLGRAVKLALADPDDLAAQLTDLLGHDPSAAEMIAAASLHEKLLEDLSALNVGTIHSFCQLVLSRFAAEAGLDPHFSVLENPEDLVEEALDRLEVEIGTRSNLAAAARQVGKHPGAVRKAVKDVLKSQMALDRWLRSVVPEDPDGNGLSETPRLVGINAMLASLRTFLFPDLDCHEEPRPTELLTALRDALGTFLGPGLLAVKDELGSLRNDKLDATLEKMLHAKLAPLQTEITEALVTFATDDRPEPGSVLWRERRSWTGDYFDRVRFVFLTQKRTLRVFSKVKKEDAGPVFNRLVATQAKPVLEILRTFSYLELYDQNVALLRLGLRLMDIMDELKRRDRVIDFHDLEEFACRLMGDEARALSLLYRLDDSINHILLDEFQDTNFNQWDMLRPFVEEFLSGGDPERRKTVFVVGDVKQSIYGFRGAEPALFGHVQSLLERFEQRVETLPTNFRSLEAVVHGVGCLFNETTLSAHLSRDEKRAVRQSWARVEAPGEVYFLEPYAPDPDGDDQRSSDQMAADAAARLARHLVDAETETWDGFGPGQIKRALCWGDILVLCRSRTEISLYEKAFRNFGVPIMPPGRGMLAASREVQDILALLRWLVYPDDEVALSTVLRSPLFRLREAELQEALAARKILELKDDGGFRPPRGLWASIRDLDDETALGQAVAQLTRWRRHLDLDNCHNLLRRIFREGDVRERFAAALGDQARHNLLRLFDLALGPEVTGTPTVRRLIDVIDRAARLGGEEEAVVPQTGTRGRVRFMTIHGAKGLEAPVVILVDADRPIGRESTQVRVDPNSPDTPLLFKVNKALREGFQVDEDTGWQSDQLQKAGDRGRLRTAMEDANLLYVALTRARDRLYVLGGDKRRGESHDSALRQVLDAALSSQCSSVKLVDPPWLDRPALPFGKGTEDTDPWLCDDDPEGPVQLPGGAMRARIQTWTPPALSPRMKTETPSAAEGDMPSAPVGSGDGGDRQAAIERGLRVHLLLQLAADTGVMPAGDGVDHAEAAAVFGNSDLAWIFQPGNGRGVSEAPVLYRRPGDGGVETRVNGIIDRLVIRPDRVDIIDYKTNRTGRDAGVRQGLVDHYRPQLAAYREVMAAMYPDREIRTWLLFTEAAPGDLVEVTP